MCLGMKAVKASPPPVVPAAPTRDTVASAATQERRRLANQQGAYGNIFTSVLGDPTYGTNVRPTSGVAALGA